MQLSNQKLGLTLIETLITIAVTTIILFTIIESVLYFYRTNFNLIEQMLAITSARKGVEQLVEDIRESTYADDGAFPVISMSGNHFYFYSDVDEDNNKERVRYYLSQSNLYKGVTNPTGDPATYNDANEIVTVVSDYVRNEEEGVLIFNYYDSAGDPITDYDNVSDVAFVTVNLIVNINPTRLPDEFTLRSSATIRNLKVNL